MDLFHLLFLLKEFASTNILKWFHFEHKFRALEEQEIYCEKNVFLFRVLSRKGLPTILLVSQQTLFVFSYLSEL